MSRGAVVGLYVVPLLLTAVALYAVGLQVLAFALLGVEAVVAGSVALARRGPATPRAERTPRDGTTFVLVMGAVVVLAAVGLLVLLQATSP